MTNTRRPYLLGPGEPLLLLRPDPDTDTEPGLPALVKQAERLEQWRNESGMEDADVYSSPLVATPLPIYAGRIPEGSRRWPGLSPALMWHPLMWLPERLAEPYVLVETSEDGQESERLESPDEWAIRVALELTASGMYDPVTGGWVDVLALYDVDITAPGQIQRIAAWLGGAPDEKLDGIDLEVFLSSQERPDWAVQLTATLFDDVVASSWAIVADDLLSVALGIQQTAADADQARQQSVDLIELASHQIGDAVLAPEVHLLERLREIRGGMDVMSSTDVTDYTGGPLADVIQALHVVASTYAPIVDELAASTQAD